MKLEISSTDYFDKQLKRFLKKYIGFNEDFLTFSEFLNGNPKSGALLGENLYKVRMASKAKGKGKSGGFRVITYHMKEDANGIIMYLITIYDKSEEDTIKTSELKALVKSIINIGNE